VTFSTVEFTSGSDISEEGSNFGTYRLRGVFASIYAEKYMYAVFK